jgi:hypothetical protein
MEKVEKQEKSVLIGKKVRVSFKLENLFLQEGNKVVILSTAQNIQVLKKFYIGKILTCQTKMKSKSPSRF